MTARVVPSQAVAIIGRAYAWAAQGRSDAINHDHIANVALILAVVEAIPEELLPQGDDRATFVGSLGAIPATVGRWQAGGHPVFDPFRALVPGSPPPRPRVDLYVEIFGCLV